MSKTAEYVCEQCGKKYAADPERFYTVKCPCGREARIHSGNKILTNSERPS
jgi:DNA-directed RNA polymerase subunit RPC12/RpoP